MTKKINSSVKEHITILCYEVLLGEMINQESRMKAKQITENYLNNNGYKINWVKCDEENNSCDVVDSCQVILHISEEVFPGSPDEIIHIITL